MAEYAQINNSKVTQVIVADNDFILGLAGTWQLTPAKVGIGDKCSNSLFISSPGDQTITCPASINLSVRASGNDSITYQWKKDGSPIDGETNSSLVISSSSPSDSGSYTCVISDMQNTLESDEAIVTAN